ncbi:TetR/AcrR family transcriptional regulator [Catellatospora citrea]|uniref:TetR family transcriptional regulator n=1 Tax=Catellatospora citrea TaxID=53366 RepID=A0A8J3P0K8_9ACTN|nr:TetR/AcrR family transcriptional regulator [Catellatospora citrea]RKE09528.1 TetR family transcriptional regulator [Catellatospora citrea]GIF97490.1 TetR family transcriptional regulator [Catellatospora citrea]
MELDSAGVPANIAAAWGLRERPGKGPKPGLTLDGIVRAGIRVAAADGVGAVTMSRVAAEAGASTMALYRYVRAKDELLELMVDAAIGDPPPLTSGGDWRAGLIAWSWACRELYMTHPWTLRVPVSGPPATPHQLAWMDAGLAAMAQTGLREEAKLSIVLLLTMYVRNEATVAVDMQTAVQALGSSLDEAMAAYGKLLKMLVDPSRFPALARAIEAGVLDRADDPDEEFVFGLDRILDGVGLLIAQRAGG